ncbi:family regulatory protein [Sarocladium implicatum]|nr:family regulatory protein [Sarocladium implicatum]
MLSLLGLAQKTPERVPSDQVIPLHWFEDGFMWKKVIVYTLFAFDDALDPEVLRRALETLINRKGYRKLGGRLRRNSQGGVEYHVPAQFSASRPALTFRHVHYDDDAEDHPVASKIPKPGDLSGPTIMGDPEDLSELCRPLGKTLSLEDYLTSDRTTLGLFITTFRNKTCVSLYWPHVAFDAMGKHAIIDGWIKVLQDRQDEIPEPIGFDTDPLADFGKNATEKHLLADKRVGNVGMAGYALRNITGLVGPKEIRMVCLPAVFWQKMVADVRDDLKRGAEHSEAPFVTEGDVITAWWTRVCCSHMDKTSSTTVAAQNAMSLRRVLKNDLLPDYRPFISLALGFPTVLLPAKDVLTKPLSWLALQFRHAINDQGTRAQVESYAALQREFSATMRMPVFFGDTGMYNLFFSNWQQAGLFNFDFGAAAKVPREDGKPLRSSYIQCIQDPAFPEGWPISGKDESGNYWISGFREKGLWARVEEELKAQTQSSHATSPTSPI